MYGIPVREDRIGDSVYAVVVHVPIDALRRSERCRITRAGFFDRFRYRGVADLQRTHYLHIMERQVRLMDAEVVKRVDVGLSRIDARLAELNAILQGEAPPAVVTPLEAVVDDGAEAVPLESLEGLDRHEWARQQRAKRETNEATRAATAAARRRAADRAADVEAARIERARLLVLRDALLAEGDAVRRLWREACALRDALYTRSRFGLFGPRPTAMPSVPEYAFADGPAIVRDR